MAELDLGKIKFVWQGDWSGGTSYEKDDVVYRDGSAWIAIAASSNVQPSTANNAYWEKMAQGSDLGAITGLAAGSLIYHNGSDFVHLSIGAADTFLKSDGTQPTWGTSNLSHELARVSIYTPNSSKLVVNESYGWQGNVYVDYTPQFATTSADKIEATWDFQKGRHNGYGMLHGRYYEAGTILTRRSWAAENVDDSGCHTVWWHNGWSGQRRIGWQFRSYSSGHRPVIHAPYHYDGGGSNSGHTYCQPQYVIKEYVAV